MTNFNWQLSGLLIILLLCWQLTVSQIAPRFIAFGKLEWQQLDGCSPLAVSPPLYPTLESIGTFEMTPLQAPMRCKSKPFLLRSPRIEFDYYLRDQMPVWLLIKAQDGKVLHQLSLPPLDLNKNAEWKEQMVTLPENLVSQKVTLELYQDLAQGAESWFGFRNRINFYCEPSFLEKISESLHDCSLQKILAVLLVICLLLHISPYAPTHNQFTLLALFTVVSIGLHFRAQNYFFWDEWHIIEHLGKEGISGIFHTHNEHFLPLFWLILYLETLIFGLSYSWYLIVLLIVHALNSFLLSIFFENLIGRQNSGRAISTVLALIYLISPLHGEPLHWAFEQSLVFSQSLILLSLVAAIKYHHKHSFLQLLIITLCSICSPLLFGNSFILIFQLAAVLFTLSLTECFERQNISASTILKSLCNRKNIAPILVCLFSLTLPALLYFSHRDSNGHSLSDAQPFGNSELFNLYLFVGSQLGTVLRGVGLYPSLTTSNAQELFSHLPSWLIASAVPEIAFAYLGLAVSVLLLLFALSSRNLRPRLVLLWGLGQFWILSSLFLPALGRWQIGPQQALALRYQYSALIGLMIAMIPILYRLITLTTKPIVDMLKKVVLYSLLIVHLKSQILLSSTYNEYTTRGYRHRIIVAQHVHWQQLTQQIYRGDKEAPQMTPDELEGMQPSHRTGIIVIRFVGDSIIPSVRWLTGSL